MFRRLSGAFRPLGGSTRSGDAACLAFVSRRSVPLGDSARLKHWLKERRLAAERSQCLLAAPLRLSYLALWLKCGIFGIVVIQKSKFLPFFLRIQWQGVLKAVFCIKNYLHSF